MAGEKDGERGEGFFDRNKNVGEKKSRKVTRRRGRQQRERGQKTHVPGAGKKTCKAAEKLNQKNTTDVTGKIMKYERWG